MKKRDMADISAQVPRKAVLLVGGKGTRLRPLTNDIPKALLKVNGKTVIEHIFDLFLKHGIIEVILCVGHLKEKIRDYVGNGSSFGLNAVYVEEKRPLGTAGPLLLAKQHLQDIKSSFIVSNGDELKDIDISKMHQLHRKENASATLALTKIEDPSHYGVAKMDGSRIIDFVEKPKREEAPSNLINAGFYIMEKNVLDLIRPGFSMLEKDVFPKLAHSGKLYGFQFTDQWFDIGSIERYETAKKMWKEIKK